MSFATIQYYTKTLMRKFCRGKERPICTRVAQGVLATLSQRIGDPIFLHQMRKTASTSFLVSAVLSIILHTAAFIERFRKYPHYSLWNRIPLVWNDITSPPILIYQMGKVGSKSIAYSLTASGVKNVHHIHFLQRENVYMFSPRTIQSNQRIFWENTLKIQQRLCEITPLQIHRLSKVRIITMIRDPIARNISLFFHLFPVYTGSSAENTVYSIETLNQIFLHQLRHTMPLDWFDLELKAATGIDVYQYTFPKEQGHLIIEENSVNLLILKCELPDDIKVQVVSDFLGIEGFHLKRENEGLSKVYGEIYKRFLVHSCIPLSYIEALYQSRYMQHFYSQEEIDSMRSKWTRSSEV